MSAKYPDIHVRLVGVDDSAFFIIGRVRAALRKGGVEKDEIEQFRKEALDGGNDNVLQTVMRWVSWS